MQKKKSKNTAQEIDFHIYTKYPPKKKYTSNDLPTQEELDKIPAHLSETWQSLRDNWLPFTIARDTFEKNRNPVYLLQAFQIAHKNGFYPPSWVTEELFKIFNQFFKSNGKVSLDKLFGFTPGKGQEPPLKKYFNKFRDQALMLDVFRLNSMGYSIEKAAYMVCRKMEEMDGWDKTGLNLSPLQEDTIKDRYIKKWKKIFDNEPTKDHMKAWIKKNKESFLGSFPPDCFY